MLSRWTRTLCATTLWQIFPRSSAQARSNSFTERSKLILSWSCLANSIHVDVLFCSYDPFSSRARRSLKPQGKQPFLFVLSAGLIPKHESMGVFARMCTESLKIAHTASPCTGKIWGLCSLLKHLQLSRVLTLIQSKPTWCQNRPFWIFLSFQKTDPRCEMLHGCRPCARMLWMVWSMRWSRLGCNSWWWFENRSGITILRLHWL